MAHLPTRGDGPVRFGPDVADGARHRTGHRGRRRLHRPGALRAGARERAAPQLAGDLPLGGDRRRRRLRRPGRATARRSSSPAGATAGSAGFHNVCQHRGARIVAEPAGCARRFTCRWHSWVYDLEGAVVGVPDREDFDEAELRGLAAPPVECAEWGGWVWGVLAGAGRRPAVARVAGPGHHRRPRRVPDGGHAPGREAGLGRAGQLEGHRRRVQRELPRRPPAREEHQAAGRARRPVQHLLRARPARDDGDPVQGCAAAAARDARSPEPGDLPLHGVPDRGLQLQPDPHPAVPRRAARGRPQPLRVLGTAVPRPATTSTAARSTSTGDG